MAVVALAAVGLEWEQTVVDARDPVGLGRWWAGALGWVIVNDASDEFEIRPERDRLPGLIFEPVDDEKRGKNRLHLDFRPDDQDFEVRRLLQLGASRVDVGQGDASWVVLADPEGNEFCVLRSHGISSSSRIVTVERMFDHLAHADWGSFGALLAPEVERIGPFGERLEGRDAYVELMAGGSQATSADDGRRTSWDLHDVAYTSDGRSAFARITAHVPRDDREMQIEQTLAFTLDEGGLITRIEVFWRDPRP